MKTTIIVTLVLMILFTQTVLGCSSDLAIDRLMELKKQGNKMVQAWLTGAPVSEYVAVMINMKIQYLAHCHTQPIAQTPTLIRLPLEDHQITEWPAVYIQYLSKNDRLLDPNVDW